MLNGIFRQQPGVVRRSTSDDEHFLHFTELILGQALLVEDNPPILEVPREGVADSGRLLIDFLLHEGVITALFSGRQVPVNGEGLAFLLVTVEVREGVAIFCDGHRGVLADLHRLVGVFDERGDVGTQEHFVLADANNQRRRPSGSNDAIRVVSVCE